MKFPKLFKKAAALVMAAVTTFSVLPATTAFAAGDIGTISFDFTYDRNGNAMRYNSVQCLMVIPQAEQAVTSTVCM